MLARNVTGMHKARQNAFAILLALSSTEAQSTFVVNFEPGTNVTTEDEVIAQVEQFGGKITSRNVDQNVIERRIAHERRRGFEFTGDVEDRVGPLPPAAHGRLAPRPPDYNVLPSEYKRRAWENAILGETVRWLKSHPAVKAVEKLRERHAMDATATTAACAAFTRQPQLQREHLAS